MQIYIYWGVVGERAWAWADGRRKEGADASATTYLVRPFVLATNAQVNHFRLYRNGRRHIHPIDRTCLFLGFISTDSQSLSHSRVREVRLSLLIKINTVRI